MSSAEASDLAEITDELLRRLYMAHFPKQEPLFVRDVLLQHGWEEGLFWRALQGLSSTGLAKMRDSGPRYEMQPKGVLAVEARRLIPEALILVQQQIRTALLAIFAEAYESRGPDERGELHYRVARARATEETGADAALVDANLEFLFAAGYLRDPGTLGYFVIADVGLHAVRQWRVHSDLERAFDALKAVSPASKRGREFQGLFGRLARAFGWMVDESEGGPGEEIDLILGEDDTYYLVECRWTAAAVEAKDIRDFQGKLRKRSGVFGLFVSMSGYTAGAVQEAQGSSGEAPMVLIGSGEVGGLFGGAVDLSEMLREKRRLLVLRREVPWR